MADYEPYAHRMVKKPTTNVEALMHLLKGALGTGILAMPKAFMHSGIVVGFIGTFIISALCAYGIQILVRTKYILCKRKKVPQMKYPIALRTALEEGPICLRCIAPFAVTLVDGFLILNQFGVCSCYVVFVTANLRQIIETETDFRADLRLHILFYLVPVAMLMCLRNLKKLAPISALANVMIFLSLIVIMYYIFEQFPNTNDRDMLGEPSQFPLFVGITLFAMESIGVSLSVEHSMKNAKSFRGYFGVLNQAIFITCILYSFIGMLGYIKYGPDSAGSITLNLPADELPAKVVKVLYAMAVFFSYGLHFHVLIEIVWESYILKRLNESKKLIMYEYALRMVLVVITFLMAILIPNLGLFISLIGAMSAMMSFSFPAMMEICVQYPDNYGRARYLLWKNVLLIVFGISAVILGVTTTIIALIRIYSEHKTL